MKPKHIPSLQVSKWVKIPFLVDVHEIQEFIEKQAPAFKLYDVQKVTSDADGVYEPPYFLDKYATYISYLKKGETPPLAEFRGVFSMVWSVTDSALISLPAGEGRRLLKNTEPAVQTQINQIRYSEDEKTFRTQVYSNDSISWGIQIGFPHLFLDPTTYEATSTREFPNMALFLAIQRWVRKATVPTPFLIHGEKLNSPIRLGKQCFSWIEKHPQLKNYGIEIDRRAFAPVPD